MSTCIRRCWLALMVLCLVGCHTGTDTAADEDQIRSLRQSLARAANARDYKSMEQFLAPEITLEDLAGTRRTVSRAEYLDKYRSAARRDNFTFSVQVDQIDIQGDSARMRVTKRATIQRVTGVTGDAEEIWHRTGAIWQLTGMRGLNPGQEVAQ